MTLRNGVPACRMGRPKGSGAKQLLFKETVWPHAAEISAKVLEMARNGNEAMLKVITDRLYPRPQDNMVFLEASENYNEQSLLKLSESVIKLVSNGDLLPEEGETLNNMLKAHRDSLALQGLADQLAKLQAKVDEMGKK